MSERNVNNRVISAEEQRHYEIEALKGKFAEMEEALSVGQGIGHGYLRPVVVVMRDENGRIILDSDLGV